MSGASDWLDARAPAPPPPLAAWLAAHAPERPHASSLADAALEALERVRARPGRARESAFELLGADALLTYASEAALGEDDPLGALEALVVRVAAAP